MRNSIDAVADRDFALDYLYAAAVLFTHLSRIGEEIVLWATAEFGFMKLPEGAATGSSMMPQKLNPDVAELVRGKAGTAIGRLTGLLATVKGLPLAYDRDLQEDKPPVFATRRELSGPAGPARPDQRAGRRPRPAGDGGLGSLAARDRCRGDARRSRGWPSEMPTSRWRRRCATAASRPRPVARTGPAPGPGGVRAALADAKQRFSGDNL